MVTTGSTSPAHSFVRETGAAQSAEGIASLARAFRRFCEVRQGTRPCPADRSTGRDGDSAVPGSVLFRSPSTSVPLVSAPLVLQPRSWANPPLAGDSWQLASPISAERYTHFGISMAAW